MRIAQQPNRRDMPALHSLTSCWDGCLLTAPLTSCHTRQIGDFGLATVRDVEDSSGHDQSIVGTPHFMSPELLNRKKYDYKTDVW